VDCGRASAPCRVPGRPERQGGGGGAAGRLTARSAPEWRRWTPRCDRVSRLTPRPARQPAMRAASEKIAANTVLGTLRISLPSTNMPSVPVGPQRAPLGWCEISARSRRAGRCDVRSGRSQPALVHPQTGQASAM
jgi:hypothetical protein